MKIKSITLLILSAFLWIFLQNSCTGFLDEDYNPNELSPSIFWKNEDDILKGLTSVYAYLQPNMNWAAPFERFIVTDNYRSDELDFRADVTSWLQLATFTNESDNSVVLNEWNYLYKGINYANQCIENIPNVQNTSDDTKNKAVAEARFLRAYLYYRLLINFGDRIPLFTTQITGSNEEFYPPQAETGVIKDFIENELIEIQNTLPGLGIYVEKEKGRVTKYAAIGLLGKLYMFTNELKKAEKEFEKIIGQFELMENYNHNFDGLHKNNKESIFEIQFSGDEGGGLREFNRIALHLASSNAGGYEEAYPSFWLFETLKDDKTIDGEYSDRLYSTIVFNDPKTKTFYMKDGEGFLDYHQDGEIYWNKFVSWDPSLSSDWKKSAFNMPIIRYADILLLYAECLNDRGNSTEAIQYINQVRKRVNVPDLPNTMTKEQILKHLQDVERPCELALEGVRWYDLIRWNITKSALEEHGKPFVNNFIESKHLKYPIPHAEFLLNPNWEQNPNFGK